jgi:hypothetical protein
MERRSQQKTGLGELCPVLAWAQVVHRVIEDFPEEEIREDLSVCSYRSAGKRYEVTSRHVMKLLQRACQVFDGERRYGIRPDEICTRSIRWGVAMSLAVLGGN